MLFNIFNWIGALWRKSVSKEEQPKENLAIEWTPGMSKREQETYYTGLGEQLKIDMQKVRDDQGEEDKRRREKKLNGRIAQQTVLYYFQQNREEPPHEAENRLHSNCLKPDTHYSDEEYLCPKCSVDLIIDHGQRVLCECGWLLELYGNLLVVWEDKIREPDEREPLSLKERVHMSINYTEGESK